MKKFYLKLFIFLLPFLTLYFLELFVLPIDYFSFRCWECLKTNYFVNLLGGPFYPNINLNKLEEGDLGARTKWSKKRRVNWVTDSYGFRFDENRKVSKYDIVIVGDSFVVGTGLDQVEMLDNQLSILTGKSVYPYAPYTFNEFMEDERFIKNMPKTVVYAVSEAHIKLEENFLPKNYYRPILRIPPQNVIVLNGLIFIDRVIKQSMLHCSQARIQEYFFMAYKKYVRNEKNYIRNSAIVSSDGGILFHKYEFNYPNISKEKITIFKKRLLGYKSFIENMGSKFIVMPIPSKSTIYYEKVPIPYPDGLSKLTNHVSEIGINIVDVIPYFMNIKNKKIIYQTDDTHLNKYGVFYMAKILSVHL